jgi:hypothetical protein
MRLFKIVAIAVLFMFCTAASCDNVVKPDPKLPTDTEMCGAACANLQELGCEEGEDFTDGEGQTVTCIKFCEDTQKSGHALNPTCAATITACDQLEPECSEK